MSHTLDECCTRCEECERRYCREETGTCPDCQLPFKSCGRVDEHEPHDWSSAGWRLPWWLSATHSCTGEVAIEGGARCAD